MFECLTGILEAKLKAQNDMGKLQSNLSSDVTQIVEEIISNSGIGFMTTSLTYTQSTIKGKAKNLSYCALDEDERPFIIYDERPLMYPGEYGFCFTDKRFAGKPEYGDKYDISLSDISRFEKKGSSGGKFTVYTLSDSQDINAANLSELDKFVDCLNKVLKVIPQNVAKVNSTEAALNKRTWLISAQCLDEHPFLIEYFGMEEKADEIYEKSGKAAERKQTLEACTDENLSVCDEKQLKQYLKAVKTLRIPEDVRADLCAKITAYLDLLHSCKDKNTLLLLECCEDEKIEDHSYLELCTLRGDVERHSFLPTEKKEYLLGKIVPRINLLDFQNRLSAAGNRYGKLTSLYKNLGNEPLSQDQIDLYAKELKEKITAIQTRHLSEITAGIEAMTHSQIKDAMSTAAQYNFDYALLDAQLKRLNDRLDEVERQTVADFCSNLPSASISDILSFKEKLKSDDFKRENISVYLEQMDARYWTLIYEESCEECKQTVLSKEIVDLENLYRLLHNFKHCGKPSEQTSPYVERVENLLNIRQSYEQKRSALVSETHNKLVAFVSQTITQGVWPHTGEFDKPEVYICENDRLKEYSCHDICRDLYVEDEAPVFYIFQLDGSKKIPNLSITNNAMYLSKSSSNGQIVRIPLETITELKPAKIFNEISVVSVTGTGTIYSLLPYKAKVFLANGIYEIVKFAARNRPQAKQLLINAHNEYLQNIADCFARCPIPNDDQLVVNTVTNSSQAQTASNVAANSGAAEEKTPWLCRCGKVNEGKFCPNCGAKRETGTPVWKCSCGNYNKGNFCPKCGSQKF